MRVSFARLSVTGLLMCWSGAVAHADPGAPTKSQSVEVLAYGFPGIDEHDLGALFDVDLGRLDGSPRLFAKATPRRVARGEVDKHLLRTTSSTTTEGGVHFLFVGLDAHQTDSRDTVVYHSHEVKNVFTIDDDVPRNDQDVPAAAVFYLAEVHTGSTVDMIVEGEYSETGAKLTALFAAGQGALSAGQVSSSGKYDVRLKGLGVRDLTGKGVFAMSLDAIAKNYGADPAPIELVFKTVPGRSYKPVTVELPTVVVDESFKLADRKARNWSVPPGRYRFVGSSRPNGLGIAWSSDVDCDQAAEREYRDPVMTCTVVVPTTLTVSNPPVAHDIADTLGSSPDEAMKIYVAKLPGSPNAVEGPAQELLAAFDRLVDTTVTDKDDCGRMARDVGPLIDDVAAMIKSAKSNRGSMPEWGSQHIKSSTAKLVAAVGKCNNDERVKVVFARFGNGNP